MPEQEIIFVVRRAPDDGYEAHALGHAIFTQAESLDELKAMLRDALLCHFDDDARPNSIRLRMVTEEVIRV